MQLLRVNVTISYNVTILHAIQIIKNK